MNKKIFRIFQRPATIIFLGLTIAIVAYLIIPEFKIFTLSVSGIFYTGYSDAKLFLFFFTFLICLLFTRIFRNKIINWQKRDYIILYSLILGLGILGILLTVYVYNSNNISVKLPIAFASNGVVDTSMGITHTHILKPSFTFPLTFFTNKLAYYGTGLSIWFQFIELRPFFILGTVMLILLSFFFIKYLISKKLTGINFLLFVILSFGLLKSLIDGGMFYHEFYCYFAFLSLFFFNKNRPFVSFGFTILGITLLTWLKFSLLVGHLYLPALKIYAFDWQQIALTIALSALWLWTIFPKKAPLFITMLCIALLLQFKAEPLRFYTYAKQTVPAGATVYITSPEKLDLEIVAKEGDFNVYKYTNLQTTTILDIHNKYSHSFYENVQVDKITCNTDNTVISKFTIYNKSISKESLKDSSLYQNTSITKWGNNSEVTIDRFACLYSTPWLPYAYLESLGFDTLILSTNP